MVKSGQHLKQNRQTRSLAGQSLLGFGLGRARTGWLRAAAVSVAWTLISVPVSVTATSAATEYEVKAAYLFNLGK
ncbi:MAG: hypothetical protein ACREP9_22055, partial [Candidatus Dormibacteraceae bacterium]